jgi:nitrite reductase/ring-hydroxylating ferredoxin subunit
MTHWVEAIRLEDIPRGSGRTVEVAGRSIALFNIEGTIYAIDDICPHMGQSLGVGVGVVEGKMVRRPWPSGRKRIHRRRGPTRSPHSRQSLHLPASATRGRRPHRYCQAMPPALKSLPVRVDTPVLA